ncbi:hypothetical protein Caci_2843 [Catenulispora acidiphila DSM 44928]|uniref:Uncharacterized protein n=1 Tax=Catenulispora acidiphila (strain DSM 44928 / JCM 14897 / NBRC 102108 / NRRL B-24433 / ID139908) TaxID=479433 RepID=C7Q177_CATAD|nr:hypothetical protein [Catenulispora acidiphila]ACU71752.1 hypothetical protein Caci_2843 [Catenulispora acidiphila DSM 44928]
MADEATGLPHELADLGFEEVRVARVQPGVVIVLMTSKQITDEQAAVMHQQLSTLFEGHRVAILQDGLFLEVLRPTQDAPTQTQLEYKADAFDASGFMDEARKHVRMRGYGGLQ